MTTKTDMNKLIIFGTGDFAQVAYFYFKHDSNYEVVAFTANQSSIKEKSLFDLPIVPFENLETTYPVSEFALFIAIGYTNMNKVRAEIYSQAKNKGYKLVSYVNSKAITWRDLSIGDNCFILENVVIQPFVKIGNNVVIWSGNHIGHHTSIADHCFITSHVVISGNVKIGPYCFLGINASVRDDVTIASECLIGAGAVILSNTKEKEVYTVDKTKLLPITSDKLHNI